ncbi:MAG: SOS response-associated peptidase [Saprospiraceae bacterium]|nr:SOS response-associated peptidase [Saprospiraceae bacterium]
MCFHSLVSMTDQQLAKHFRVTLENMEELAPQFHINAFTYPKTPVITNLKKNALQRYQWGLIPSWSKDEEIKKYTLNAKVETIHEKPSFKGNVKNRCLVPSNGFYEWQWLDEKGKSKRKFIIKVKGEEVFAFAGLWSEWTNKKTGEVIHTYTILTTEANELMSEIHNSKKRMPIIVRPDEYDKWLNQEEIDFNGNELTAELSD